MDVIFALQFSLVLACGVSLGYLTPKVANWLPARMNQLESEWLKEVLSERAQNDSFKPIFKEIPGWVFSFVTSALIAVLFFQHGFSVRFFSLSVFVWFLVTLAAIDLKTMLLPDELTQPLLWMGLLLQIHPATQSIGLQEAVLGAAAGYAFFWLFGQTFLRLRGKEGLGYGDVKLVASCGAWLGIEMLPALLLTSSLLALVGQSLKASLHAASFDGVFAFGPWIAVSALACVIWL